MSKGGLEPPRSYERQPLKLVRLPISPLRRGCASYIDALSAPTKAPITLKTFFIWIEEVVKKEKSSLLIGKNY